MFQTMRISLAFLAGLFLFLPAAMAGSSLYVAENQAGTIVSIDARMNTWINPGKPLILPSYRESKQSLDKGIGMRHTSIDRRWEQKSHPNSCPARWICWS